MGPFGINEQERIVSIYLKTKEVTISACTYSRHNSFSALDNDPSTESDR